MMANEKRLIDANALMKAIKDFRWYGGYPPNTLKLMFDYLKIIIDQQPIESAPTSLHGHWVGETGGYMWRQNCSICNFPVYNKMKPYYNYCPSCGAKMDDNFKGVEIDQFKNKE